MRTFSFKATVAQDLLELGASERDVRMIGKAVRQLAAKEVHRFKVPFQNPLLRPDRVLYQFQVKHFKVNYTLTENELIVESVTL